MSKKIDGFSKLTKSEKIDWITRTHFQNPLQAKEKLESYWNADPKLQNRHEEFIENTLSNFYLPLGVAPNFLINGVMHTLPMVTEESSVVAAAGNAAKFWSTRGGFKTEIINTLKVGQVHFLFEGNSQEFMVTPDKDFAQLVSENIFMYRPARMGNGIEIWGIPEESVVDENKHLG